MKISKLFYSLFIGLTIYSLLTFFEGETGLKSMAKVEAYKKILNANLENIKEINRKLGIKFDSLSSDNELIKLRARALGYFDKKDHIVHIANWNPDYNEYKPGHVIKKEYLTEVDEGQYRLISLGGGLFSLILLLFISRLKKFLLKLYSPRPSHSNL